MNAPKRTAEHYFEIRFHHNRRENHPGIVLQSKSPSYYRHLHHQQQLTRHMCHMTMYQVISSSNPNVAPFQTHN